VILGSLGQPDVVDRAVQGVEVVYHVGAAMKGGKEEFEQGTIWGTRNVIDACVRHGAKLVYVSSMSVADHAGHATGTPVTESSPYEPYPDRRGVYTQTKYRAEQMVLEAIRDHGLRAVIVRPGQIFGPGAEHVTPNGVIGLAGRWIVAGNGERQLPLVYRDDVVDALILAERASGAEGQLINVVDARRAPAGVGAHDSRLQDRDTGEIDEARRAAHALQDSLADAAVAVRRVQGAHPTGMVAARRNDGRTEPNIRFEGLAPRRARSTPLIVTAWVPGCDRTHLFRPRAGAANPLYPIFSVRSARHSSRAAMQTALSKCRADRPTRAQDGIDVRRHRLHRGAGGRRSHLTA
jgi:hypothetical protein